MSYLPRTILVFAILLFIAVPGFAQQETCSDVPDIIVLESENVPIEEICGASAKALAFLSQFHLEPKRPIYIEIIGEQIESQGYIAFGSYNSRTDRIRLMSYSSLIANTTTPQMYGEPFDKVHYSGAIAHEVAHAVFQHNLQAELISTSSQEYLAHATQLAVMPDERRNAIIEAMAVDSWLPGDAISDVYMAMAPGRFAVKSYKHLIGMADPVSFVKILLNAKWFYVYVP